MDELSTSSRRTNAGKYMFGNKDSSSLQAVSTQNSNKNIASARKPLLARFEDYSSAGYSEHENFAQYKGAYFRDGQRSIDMVLVFHSKRTEYDARDTKRRQKREKFINELIRNGVEIEIETVQYSKEDIFFVKLYAPLTTLQKKAEDMKLKLPFSLLAKRPEMDVAITSLPFTRKDDMITSHSYRYFLLTPFVRQHADKFLAKGECFSILHRIAVVERILNDTCFSERENEFGVKTLVNQHVFTAVYPPHDSENGRQKLAKDWATFRNLYMKQPMNMVKSYFGTSLAFYFIWLGFVTQYLWPLAALSIMVLIYGGLTLSNYTPVKEICSQKDIKKFWMCPQCDKQCDFWYLSEVCNFIKVAHVFDNDMTVILAFLVSIWSLFLIKFWNRHHSKLAFQWQTYEIEKDDEASRPEYVAKVSTIRRNIATGELEQYIPFGTECGRYALVIVVVVFMICVVLANLLGVVIYRAAVYTTLITHAKGGFDKHARVITDITAGVITLISINILSYVYTPIAQRLTDWETPRTQSQWERNFTYKMFTFQFVNWYSSLFYIAFFKTEHFTGVPGDHTRYTKHGYRLEGCPIEGCSIELCIQLGVIMIGQMFLQNITEICKPYMKKWFAIRKFKDLYNNLLPWQREYFLTPSHETLFWEYMEIVLQLGFVMMFTAAFPLAPFIAFINAMLEIRLDAIKFIHFQRRPLPMMATCSGAWQNILEQLAEWSVLVNALVIAMTTDFIPKLVYQLSYSNDYSLKGFVNNSLSYFNTSWFPEVEKPVHAEENHNHLPTLCRYPGYHEINGDYSLQYWHVLAIRIIFVLMFYYVITSFRTGLNWMVADEPWQVEARRKRTIYFIKRLFKLKTKRTYDAVNAA